MNSEIDDEKSTFRHPEVQKIVEDVDEKSNSCWTRRSKVEKSLVILLGIILFGFVLLFSVLAFTMTSIDHSLTMSVPFIVNQTRDNEIESLSIEILEQKLEKISQTFAQRFPRSASNEAPNSIPLPLNFYHSDNLTNEEKIDEIFASFDGDYNNEANPWELHDWIIWVDQIVYNSKLEDKWASFYKSYNDLLSWTDYLTQIYPNGAKDRASQKIIAKNERRWRMADKNGDNRMNKSEFKHFLFPQLNTRAEGLSVTVHEAFEDLDINEDNEVSKYEFVSIHHPNATDRMEHYFDDALDVDSNGYLSLDEISHWVDPVGFIPAKSEVIYLMEKLDNNRNRQLSKDEVMNYPHIFINSQITFFEDIYRIENLRNQVFRYRQ